MSPYKLSRDERLTDVEMRSDYLQEKGVLLVGDLQRRGAPHIHNRAAWNSQPGLGRLEQQTTQNQ